ncbi:hypothetical protein FACS1894172_03410 [Spirochaetia bacterium]|nr:hypothetical protein FACS1894172_03410 [Spirochaetia bacterium]
MLSGISQKNVFESLVSRIDGFVDFIPQTVDYKYAAECCNTCRIHGIQGSATDFLICAVSVRNGFEIFTEDTDFLSYTQYLPIKLYKI